MRRSHRTSLTTPPGAPPAPCDGRPGRAPARAGSVLLALLAAVLSWSLVPPPPPASAAFTAPSWLCRPDRPSDVCRESLDTTVRAPDGSSRVVPGRPDPAAPVDCLYVYPTASNELGPSASGDPHPEIEGIARFQAQRFSQQCRVYVPLYRQITVPALFLGPVPQSARDLAYADVLAAWRAYLANDNRGRGVVLIGHSQGTGLLRRLIREEIDQKPEVRSRLVSALLLGGDVLVKTGSDRGGDFENVPLCRANDQSGCVVAWSAFGEDPPANARFGRAPTGTDRLTGGPAKKGVEVACTNPASLAENRESEVETLVPTAPFPVGLIGVGTILAGVPSLSASTPWVRTTDRYTARCEHVANAHVLMIRTRPGGNALHPAPEPGWGLHLVDVNVAFGELQRLVASQSAAWAAARATPAPAAVPAGRPRVALTVRHRTRRGPDGRRCVASALSIRVTGADRSRVRRADFRLRGRSILRDRRSPFVARVARTRLAAGRANRVDALVTLADGRRRRVAATVRGCATG